MSKIKKMSVRKTLGTYQGLASVLAVFIALIAWPSGANSQSYSIQWFTVDGGGGTSSGGDYSLSGTIGQPDTGKLSGGNYTLLGGFWSGFGTVQVTEAPLLSIETTTEGAILSWEPATPGFVLQYNDDLTSTNWIYADSEATNPVVVSPAPGMRYFRLHKP